MLTLGRIRLGSMRSYWHEEAGRRDMTEGKLELSVLGEIPVASIDSATEAITGEWTEPGYSQIVAEALQPTYLFCVSSPKVSCDHLRSTFGEHVVEVYDTGALASRLRTARVISDVHRKVLGIDMFKVRYDKGGLGRDPSRWLRRFVNQKPSRFSEDCEWRVAVFLKGLMADSPREIFLEVDNPSSCFRSAETGSAAV